MRFQKTGAAGEKQGALVVIINRWPKVKMIQIGVLSVAEGNNRPKVKTTPRLYSTNDMVIGQK